MDPENSFHACIDSGDYEMANQILVKAKASNSLVQLLASRDLRRLTPIHAASNAGNLNFVDLLIEYKANLNALDGSGETSLHKAASRGYFAVCETLFTTLIRDNEASCVLDGNMHSAFYRAAHKGHADIVELFLSLKPSYFSDVLDGGFAAIRAGHPNVAQKIVDSLKNAASVPGDRSISLDSGGFHRTVQQLQTAVREWSLTSRDMTRQCSDHEAAEMRTSSLSINVLESEPLDHEEREIAAVMALIPKGKVETGPRRSRLANILHIPPTNCDRRLPLRNHIISAGVIKVDGVKAPSAGPEDPDIRGRLPPGRELLLDGPPRTDGPVPDGRDDLARAVGGPSRFGSSGSLDRDPEDEDLGPVVFNFEILLAPAPAGSWDDGGGEDSDEGVEEWGDPGDECVPEDGGGDGAVFEFDMGTGGEWAQGGSEGGDSDGDDGSESWEEEEGRESEEEP